RRGRRVLTAGPCLRRYRDSHPRRGLVPLGGTGWASGRPGQGRLDHFPSGKPLGALVIFSATLCERLATQVMPVLAERAIGHKNRWTAAYRWQPLGAVPRGSARSSVSQSARPGRGRAEPLWESQPTTVPVTLRERGSGAAAGPSPPLARTGLSRCPAALGRCSCPTGPESPMPDHAHWPCLSASAIPARVAPAYNRTLVTPVHKAKNTVHR